MRAVNDRNQNATVLPTIGGAPVGGQLQQATQFGKGFMSVADGGIKIVDL
jgi:hypothetical protein